MRRVCALAITLLGACGGAPPPQPQPEPACDRPETIQVRFSPRPQLNHDREGYARSVVVRIYQLDAADAFSLVDFDSVWAQQASAPSSLPSVVAGPDELTLLPGREVSRQLKRQAGATHIAITAKFREHHPNSGWQAVSALPIPKDACKAPTGPRLSVELVNSSLRMN